MLLRHLGSMEKAARAQLVRQRFKAKGGFAYVCTGQTKQKAAARPKPPKIYFQWPQANRDTARAGVWMHKPDAKPKVAPRTRHNAGMAVLTKIAAKEPGKLKRRHATAEGLLSERRPQKRQRCR